MDKENKLAFRVFGRRALFTTPDSKIGGEKFSYQIPTYEALVGIAGSIYWKPTIVWRIHRIRIMNPIQTESVGIKLHKMDGKSDLSFYTFLKDVEYEVEMSFVWNENRPDLKQDRNENKHYAMAKRSLERGGRRDVFLGVREAQAYVEPVEFGAREMNYDPVPEFAPGLMFHSFSYPDQNPDKNLVAHFWYPVVKHGVVEFIAPDACPIKRILKQGEPKDFVYGESVKPIVEEVQLHELSE